MPRKQIYIGLGGQGAKTICELKKQIHQLKLYKRANRHSAGFDAPHAFLSIDSSPDIWETKAIWQCMGRDLSPDENERYLLRPNANATRFPNVDPWLFSPDPNQAQQQEAALGGIDNAAQGAQQRRRYGRMLFAANAEGIDRAIANAFVRAAAADAANEADFHVFCSLGGGTGSGGIVDLVNLIRQNHPNPSNFAINVYVYLADANGVARASIQGFFFENQYCALRDLDNLSTGVFRPHAMVGKNMGRRTKLDTPINCIRISTNLNGRDQAVSIGEQIKRTASWALGVATLDEGADNANIHRILTLEDKTANTHGEPNDTSEVFIARSIRSSSLGAARWSTAVDELSLIAAYDIQLSSYRQMLYNNLGVGYLDNEAPIPQTDLASYNKIEPSDFTLDREIKEGWDELIRNEAELKQILDGPRDVDALTRLNTIFRTIFVDRVQGDNTDCTISMPSRQKHIIDSIRAKMGIKKENYTNVTALYLDYIESRMTQEWKDGKIGLQHTQRIIDSCINAVKNCRTRLTTMSDDMQGTKVAPIEERMTARQEQWEKLTGVSYPVAGKGKAFLKAQMDDLVALYTLRSQRQQIDDACGDLNNLINRLRELRDALGVPIGILTNRIERIVEQQTKLPLFKFLFLNEPKRVDQELEYDYNESYKQMLHHVHTNMEGKWQTIEAVATEIRNILFKALAANQQEKDSILNLRIDGTIEDGIMRAAFQTAGNMLRQADERYNTTNMEGMLSKTRAMEEDKFDSKLQQLLTSASFSYKTDPDAPSSTYAYREQYNSECCAWVVNFPNGITVNGILQNNQMLRERVLRLLGNDSNPDDVYICMKPDNTQISVWEAEYVRPMRKASIVAELAGYNAAMDAGQNVEQLFWKSIDDEALKLMCPLTFPTEEEQQIVRVGSRWLARRLPQYFDFNEAEGIVCLRNNDQTIIHNLRNESLMTNTTCFAFSVQKEISAAIIDRQELTTQAIRDMYQAELEAIPAQERNRRQAFRKVINEFIEKTLLRIDQQNQARGNGDNYNDIA